MKHGPGFIAIPHKRNLETEKYCGLVMGAPAVIKTANTKAPFPTIPLKTQHRSFAIGIPQDYTEKIQIIVSRFLADPVESFMIGLTPERHEIARTKAQQSFNPKPTQLRFTVDYIFARLETLIETNQRGVEVCANCRLSTLRFIDRPTNLLDSSKEVFSSEGLEIKLDEFEN